MPSVQEQHEKQIREGDLAYATVCSYSIMMKIAPHTWGYVETVDLLQTYNLARGQYTIFKRPVSQPTASLATLKVSVP
jgi:hypothetical protein